MKKLRYLFLVAAVAMTIVGCRKPVEVSFAVASQEFEAQGETVEVALKSNGEWTINPTAEWLAVSPMSGSGDVTLTLTAGANTTGLERTAEVVATTKDNTATLTVSQKAVVLPENYLVVTPTEFQCGGEGSEFTVEVSSNINWTVTTPNWITSSVTEGSNNAMVTLTVKPVDGDFGEMREANVVFGNMQVSDKVHVIQATEPIMGIEIAPQNLFFVCTGETKTVTVTTEDAWTAAASMDWVVLSQSEGQGNAEISVTLGENPLYEQRQANVRFTTAGGVQAILIIRQEASLDPHFLEVSPLEFHFGKEGGEREITVGCDTDWEFYLNADWMALSQVSGTGIATVVLTVEPNLMTEPRTTEFHIKSGVLSYDLTISQEAGDIPLVAEFDVDTVFAAYTGGLYNLNLTSNTTWYLQYSSEWITINSSSGEGDASFDIIVDVNQSPEERIGFVKAVHSGQVLGIVTVVQEGKPDILEASLTEIEARPEGGTYDIQVTANQSWYINCDVDWIGYEPREGFGNKTVTLTVKPMDGALPRTGTLKLTGASGKMVRITVNQHL